MVRYYGRARQITGTVFTNQPGLKQAGCPGTVGKRGTIARFLGRRVNCNLKTCGLPMSGLRCKYGVRGALGNMLWTDVESSNNPAIKDYCHQVVNKWNGVHCRYPQPKNRQLAGGVGNIYSPRRNHCEQTCSLGWEEKYMNKHPDGPVGGAPYATDWIVMAHRPLPAPRYSLGVAVGGDVSGALFAVGGRISEHQPVQSGFEITSIGHAPTVPWTPMPPMLHVPRSSFGMAAMEKKVYIVGGTANPNPNSSPGAGGQVFNWHGKGEWSDMSGNLNTPRLGLGLAVLPMNDGAANFVDKLVAVGGCDGSGNALNTIEIYNLMDRPWNWAANNDPTHLSEFGVMSTGRKYLGVATLGGYLYAVGGADDAGKALASVEYYDYVDDEWYLAAGSLNVPRMKHGVCAGPGPNGNNYLYAAGGCDSKGNVLATVERYNPLTGVWTMLLPGLCDPPSMRIPRMEFGLVAGPASAPGSGPAVNTLYAVGGRTSGGSVLKSWESYILYTGKPGLCPTSAAAHDIKSNLL